jgi:hypothetical protein
MCGSTNRTAILPNQFSKAVLRDCCIATGYESRDWFRSMATNLAHLRVLRKHVRFPLDRHAGERGSLAAGVDASSCAFSN